MSETLTYAAVVGMHNALAVLSRRTLPTLTSDLKVARLFRAITPTVEEFNALRKKRIEENTIDGKLNEAAASNAIAELLDADAALTLPDIRITEADLPKKLSGEGGDANREGVASVIIDLRCLYVDTADEPKE